MTLPPRIFSPTVFYNGAMGWPLDVCYLTAAAVGSPYWAWRMLRTGKWRTDWAGRFGRVTTGRPKAARRLLIHAVSVGEANSIRLLVDKLRAGDGDLDIVISSTTNTGIARAKTLYEPQHRIVRYPFDLSCCVARFIDAIKPTAVALVENEVWPNFMQHCERRRIPVCVINGRLTRRSFGRYRRIGCVATGMYRRLTAAAVQTQEYADHFTALGTPPDRVEVADTLKWDTAELTDDIEGSDALAAALGIDRSRPLIVAGSTAPGEERLLIDTCPADAQLLLVPRHSERFDEAARLSPGMVRRTEHADGTTRPPDGRRLFLLDTIGELRKAYALADVAVVGRSFLEPLGGSDMIEPISLGKATIIGPHYTNFTDVMAALAADRAIQITDQPCQAAAALLDDPAAAADMAVRGRNVIRNHQGATQHYADLIMRILNGAQT